MLRLESALIEQALHYDVVIVGAGAAGIYAALNLRQDLRILLLSKSDLTCCNSRLAQGGIASIGQLQFLQPFLGLAFAAAILGESIGWSLLVVMVLVIGCVAAARRFA